MGIRDRLRRLERDARGELVHIPQRDGTVARFPHSALLDAYVTAMDHTMGLDVPDHPLCAAARNSSSAWWRASAYATEPNPREIPDLSEGA
jgi:hypothetical protein